MIEATVALAGGIGLFLLGMWLMTEGLKLSAGAALQRILEQATRTRVRGLLAGVGITALVQSSSAVTMATIGFVNAGLLQLSQAMWVLFGANLGTTMTGWLVALVGLQFSVEALALPLIGIGMVLRLTGERERRGALGMAIAGFGVLFLGIEMLKGAFSGTELALPEVGTGVVAVIVQVLAGMLLTVLTQSSSAAMAIALTAAQGGTLSLEAAAAVVIGANIGTTVKAVLAAIGATANAKRAAAAHIAFNLLTGVVALLLLPWLVGWLMAVQQFVGLGSGPALTLALFHTLFNGLGVALMWPLADRLSAFLMGRFRSGEEDIARPHYLDQTLLNLPSLAMQALSREIRRVGRLTVQAWSAGSRPPAGLATLHREIAHFITRLQVGSMAPEQADRFTRLLAASRDVAAAGELIDGVLALRAAHPQSKPAPVEDVHMAAFGTALDALRVLLAAAFADEPLPTNLATLDLARQTVHDRYDALKVDWLARTAAAVLDIETMDARLRACAFERRAAKHLARAAQLLAHAQQPSAGDDERGAAPNDLGTHGTTSELREL